VSCRTCTCVIVVGDCTERFFSFPQTPVRIVQFFCGPGTSIIVMSTVKFLTGVVLCGFTLNCSVWGPVSDDSVMRLQALGHVEGRTGTPIFGGCTTEASKSSPSSCRTIFLLAPPPFFSKVSTEHSKKQSPCRIIVEHRNRMYLYTFHTCSEYCLNGTILPTPAPVL
jgi:hypothetical protein